jgi:sugar O-acyltransferase (sialic acid O-acetyltransferase NeuD family)
MPDLILFGAGQVASLHYYTLTHDSPHRVVAFTVDAAYLNEDTLFGLPVVPFEDLERRYPPGDFAMLVSISFRHVNRLRAEKYAQARARGYTLVSHVSARAVVWPDLQLGDNTTVGASCNLAPFVQLGANVVVSGGVLVGHHTVIGDHCFLGPGAVVAGSVRLGPYCFVGAGAVIRDRLTLAPHTVVGAGAVILEDTVERGVYLAHQADRLPLTSDQLPLG